MTQGADGERVLVVNAGSSSLRLRLLDAFDRVLAAHDLPALEADSSGLRSVLSGTTGVAAVGHRVVHGGTRFTGPVLVDAEVAAALDELTALAPLHQPASLRAIAAVRELLPEAPQVACFDTAFHATMPEAAATYALPEEWRGRYALRRYGFHGLSHAYAAGRAAALLGLALDGLRIVTCHLGAGASLAAVHGGRSVDTTMGFTPLEGLVMATRSGSVDPGLVLWLQQHAGLSAEEVGDALEHRSGLAGLAGTPDMRAVVDAAAGGQARARLALDVYVQRLRAAVAAMAAAMGGLDALVFTGGVGEHAPVVRARTAAGLEFLGVALDEAANERATPDADLSAAGARVRSLVVAAREDLQIARQVRELLAAPT